MSSHFPRSLLAPVILLVLFSQFPKCIGFPPSTPPSARRLQRRKLGPSSAPSTLRPRPLLTNDFMRGECCLDAQFAPFVCLQAKTSRCRCKRRFPYQYLPWNHRVVRVYAFHHPEGRNSDCQSEPETPCISNGSCNSPEPVFSSSNTSSVTFDTAFIDVDDGNDEVDGSTSAESPLAKLDSKSTVPSFVALIRFLSATSLIWLSEPLLSLVDTTFVSWTQHTAHPIPHRPGTVPPTSLVQLAAMGPATTYMDTMLYLTYFLAIATTNQVGEHLASQNWRQVQLCTSRLLGVALMCGAVVSVVTWSAGSTILQHLVGASISTTPELLPLATGYVGWRALAAPLSVLGMVAQSFCLVTGHSSTVALSVVVASITNVIGDALWTPRFGLHGAAVATALASAVSALVLLRQVVRQMREWKRQEIESTPHSAHPVVPLISFPDAGSFRQLMVLSLPLCFRMWALMGSYAMLTWRAADFGSVALAAQNVLVRVFYLVCALPDSLGQATQVFLPPTLYPKRNHTSFRQVMRRLWSLALVSATTAALVALMLLSPWGAASWVVRDAEIKAQLQVAAPFVALSLFLHPWVTVTEGKVITQRDFRNVIITYSITLVLFTAVLRSAVGSVAGVWGTLALWQVSRLSNYWLWRSRLRKRDRTIEAVPSHRRIWMT